MVVNFSSDELAELDCPPLELEEENPELDDVAWLLEAASLFDDVVETAVEEEASPAEVLSPFDEARSEETLPPPPQDVSPKTKEAPRTKIKCFFIVYLLLYTLKLRLKNS